MSEQEPQLKRIEITLGTEKVLLPPGIFITPQIADGINYLASLLKYTQIAETALYSSKVMEAKNVMKSLIEDIEKAKAKGIFSPELQTALNLDARLTSAKEFSKS